MTEAINFFQSLKNFGFFSIPKTNNSARQLSRELIKDAWQFIAEAETEAGNAAKAETLTLSADERNLKSNLAQIAVWHHENSAKSYRRAAARYTEASRLRADQEKLLQKHSEKMLRLAQESEQTAKFLRGLSH